MKGLCSAGELKIRDRNHYYCKETLFGKTLLSKRGERDCHCSQSETD